MTHPFTVHVLPGRARYPRVFTPDQFGLMLRWDVFDLDHVKGLTPRELDDETWYNARSNFRPAITLDGVDEDRWLRRSQLMTSLNRSMDPELVRFPLTVELDKYWYDNSHGRGFILGLRGITVRHEHWTYEGALP